jgi:hypothetical protein
MLEEIFALTVALVFAVCGCAFWIGINTDSVNVQASTVRVVAWALMIGSFVLFIAAIVTCLKQG